jgi:hypothetical protein
VRTIAFPDDSQGIVCPRFGHHFEPVHALDIHKAALARQRQAPGCALGSREWLPIQCVGRQGGFRLGQGKRRDELSRPHPDILGSGQWLGQGEDIEQAGTLPAPCRWLIGLWLAHFFDEAAAGQGGKVSRGELAGCSDQAHNPFSLVEIDEGGRELGCFASRYVRLATGGEPGQKGFDLVESELVNGVGKGLGLAVGRSLLLQLC